MKEINQKRGKYIPYIFFVFFAVIFAVNFTYIYLAVKTWSGLETEDSYQKGLDYNDTIKLVKKQRDLSWKMNISFKQIGRNLGAAKLELLDKNNKPIKDAKIIVKITRPIKAGLDFQQDLQFINSYYTTKISFPVKGQWKLEFIAMKDNKISQEVKKYVIQ